MRKTLLSIILVLTAALAMAKKVQAIDRPTWLSSDAGKSLTVTRVEFTDTATVVSFHSKYKPKWWIKISQLSYLIGDDGNRYRARTGIGIKLGDEFYMPESGEADFKVCFEPMPRKTRYVDFIEGPSGWRIWGTGCGPCRYAIEHSRQLRDSIATLNDIELVFITSEDWSPKKAYDEYVAKNLANEENYRIPKTDWLRLLSLFGFNGIPHYELVAPDGKIITTDLNVGYNHMSDFNLFKDQFEKLKADMAL